MEANFYAEMIETESTHWWFRARRAVLSSLLKSLTLPASATILEAGCGSGGNLAMLSQLGGSLHAFELYDPAREHAQKRNLATIEYGKLPDNIPFEGTQFDLIGLFDVLEHVEEDAASVRALSQRLKPGGALLLTVPAHQWLYVRHDELCHHFRRYSKTQLTQLLEANGLKVEFVSFWNCILFPAAVVIRLLDFLNRNKDYTAGLKKPVSCINNLVFSIVSLESRLIPRFRLPFGLSLVVLARKA